MPVAIEGQRILIFDDEVNFTVKHPLRHEWTLWYDDATALRMNSKLSWDDNLKNIMTINSIEDFWGLLNNLRNPSELIHSANYHLFKKGVKPAWEDPINAKGGKWTYTIKSKKLELDQSWQDTIAAVVGEQFTYGDDIAGVVISIRKGGDRIAIWTKSSDEKKTLKTGTEFKKLLNSNERMYFQSHVDTAVKNASFNSIN